MIRGNKESQLERYGPLEICETKNREGCASVEGRMASSRKMEESHLRIVLPHAARERNKKKGRRKREDG